MASSFAVIVVLLACAAFSPEVSGAPALVRETSVDAAGNVEAVPQPAALGAAHRAQSLEPSNHWELVVAHGSCGPSDHFIQQVYSLRECEILCEEHGHCDAISISSVTHKCHLHSGALEPTNWDYYKCFAPVSSVTTTTTCLANCGLGDRFKDLVLEEDGFAGSHADHWSAKVCHTGPVEALGARKSMFYFDGVAMQVGAGPAHDACDSTTVFCAGGTTFGTKKQQAKAVKEAFDNEGVHPDAPAGAKPATITLCPTASTTTTTSTTGVHDHHYSVAPGEIELNMDMAKLVHNNLGGAGPDSGAAELRYSGVMVLADGRSVDLVVVAESPYAKAGPASNGLKGKFGTINLLSGRSVELKFKFESTATQHEISVPPFFFTLADLDQGNTNKKGVVGGQEMVIIRGFEEYYLMQGTEVQVGKMGDGRMTFTSSTRGYGSDNPRDPAHITYQQANRMVTLKFPDGTSAFTFEFQVSKAGRGGRNLLFAGRSALVDTGVSATTTTTSTTTELPSCVADSPGLSLDFFAASLSDNNLGGLGPSEGPADMRFQNVAVVSAEDARKVDMIVTALGPYRPHNIHLNGKAEGSFGLINLQAQETENVVDLEFRFVDPATDANVEVSEFDLSFLDLDEGITSARESVIVGGFETYHLSTGSTVTAKKINGDATEFSSSIFGERADNPQNPLLLTATQAQKTVNLHYKKVSKIQVTLKVAPSVWTYGRDFLFAGKSAVKDCGWEYNRNGELPSIIAEVGESISSAIR